MNRHRAMLNYHSIRHMKLRQILARLWVRSKRELLRVIPHTECLYPDVPKGSRSPLYVKQPIFLGLEGIIKSPLPEGLSNAVMRAGRDLRSHRFEYVGESSTYPERVVWNDKNRTRLWRMNLHYFDFAPFWIIDAAVNKNSENRDHWMWLIDSWIQDNPMGCFEAWNPYCISRRIPNWIIALQLSAIAGIEDYKFSNNLLRSLYRQSAYLYGNIEWDLPMNHLTANGRALVYAGAFFEGNQAKKWLDLGLKLIWDRLNKDVCADGGHAERSPMYHLIALQDCLECLAICKTADIEWPDTAMSILRKMTRFSADIQHPDGDIPLFNDASLGIAAKSKEVIHVADRLLLDASVGTEHIEPHERSLFSSLILGNAENTDCVKHSACSRIIEYPVAGYYVINGHKKERKVIFDCGEVGIQEVGGHAHSDLLSYEMSVVGERVVVDTGTSIYAAGPRRQYERGILAHNTISVDGHETCEPWGDYRLARRGHPGKVKTLNWEGLSLIDAGHMGFIALKEIVHRRALIIVGETLIVFDRIPGNGIHSLEARLNFHPDIRVNAVSPSQGEFAITGRKMLQALNCFGAQASTMYPSTDQLAGWYAPEFGKLVKMCTIRMVWEGSLPACCGHVFSGEDMVVHCSPTVDGWEVSLTDRDGHWHLLLGPEKIKLIAPLPAMEHHWI